MAILVLKGPVVPLVLKALMVAQGPLAIMVQLVEPDQLVFLGLEETLVPPVGMGLLVLLDLKVLMEGTAQMVKQDLLAKRVPMGL